MFLSHVEGLWPRTNLYGPHPAGQQFCTNMISVWGVESASLAVLQGNAAAELSRSRRATTIVVASMSGCDAHNPLLLQLLTTPADCVSAVVSLPVGRGGIDTSTECDRCAQVCGGAPFGSRPGGHGDEPAAVSTCGLMCVAAAAYPAFVAVRLVDDGTLKGCYTAARRAPCWTGC